MDNLFWIGIIIFMLGFIIRYISQHLYAVEKSKLTSNKTLAHAKVNM